MMMQPAHAECVRTSDLKKPARLGCGNRCGCRFKQSLRVSKLRSCVRKSLALRHFARGLDAPNLICDRMSSIMRAVHPRHGGRMFCRVFALLTLLALAG